MPEGSLGTMARLATVAAALAAYGLARLIFNAVGLRTIGPEAVGLVNLALSLGVLVSLPATAGAAPVLSRYMALQDRGDAGSIAALRRWAAAWAALGSAPGAALLVGGCLLSSAVLSSGIGTPLDLQRFVTVTLLWTALYAMHSLNRAELFALDEPASVLRLELLGLALFTLGLAVLSASHRLGWLPLTLYVVPGAVFLAVRLWKDRSLEGRASFPRRELRGFGLFALLGSMAGLGIAHGSTIVVSASSGLASAGLWATLVSLTTPLLLAPRTLSSAFLPRLSSLGRSHRASFLALSAVHQRISSLCALAFSGGLLLFAGPALSLAIGGAEDGRLQASWTMLCLGCYGVIRGEPIVTATAALGRAGKTAAAAFAGAGVCMLLWIALLPRGGMPAVACGYMAFALTAPAVVWAQARIQKGERPAPVGHLFASDIVFAMLAVVSIARSLAGAAALLIVAGAAVAAIAALVHGARRIRLELAQMPDAGREELSGHRAPVLATGDSP